MGKDYFQAAAWFCGSILQGLLLSGIWIWMMTSISSQPKMNGMQLLGHPIWSGSIRISLRNCRERSSFYSWEGGLIAQAAIITLARLTSQSDAADLWEGGIAVRLGEEETPCASGTVRLGR